MIDARATIEQQCDDADVSFAGGHDERVTVPRHAHVDVSSAIEQQSDGAQTALARGADERAAISETEPRLQESTS